MLMLMITLLDSSQNKMPQLPEAAGPQLHTYFIYRWRRSEKGRVHKVSGLFFYIAGCQYRKIPKKREECSLKHESGEHMKQV